MKRYKLRKFTESEVQVLLKDYFEIQKTFDDYDSHMMRSQAYSILHLAKLREIVEDKD